MINFNRKNLNYAIIILGSFRVEGRVQTWRVLDSGDIEIIIDGTEYKTGISNVLLMHKDLED